jgi:hypothetical protein
MAPYCGSLSPLTRLVLEQSGRVVYVQPMNGVEGLSRLTAIQNLNPDVLMVDTAEDRYRCDAAELLRPPKIRSIFIQ